MIRLTPTSEHPLIQPGFVSTGLPEFDDWWMTSYRLGGTIIEYQDKVLLAIRGSNYEWDGAGAGNYGVSVLWAPKNADLNDRTVWTNYHKDAPAFEATDLPDPHGIFPAPTTGLSFFEDPDTVTNGFPRLWITIKNKIANLDRADYPLWDQSWTGKVSGGKQTLGFHIAFREQVKLLDGATELVYGTDYTLNNEGSSTTDGEIEYLDDFSLSTITFEYQQKAYRYAFYSDDGGKTWTYDNYWVDNAGRPHQYGQPGIVKFSDGSNDWHLVSTGVPGGTEALHYMNSTGPSGGTWMWDNVTPIHDTGGNGSWDDTCVIGAVAWHESDEDYVYTMATCGGGRDPDYGTDPTSPNDVTDSANVSAQNDYPSATGLWRCPVASLTDETAWEEYAYNPISLRGSIGGPTSGGTWICGRIGSKEEMVVSYEAVGVTRWPVTEPQALNIRDAQYGKNYSALRLPTQPEYITGNLTIEMHIVAETIGGSLMRRSPIVNDQRNPSPSAGAIFIDITDAGAVELRHYYDLNEGTIQRYATTADGVITPGTEHTIVVSFSATQARIYVDGNTVLASTGPAAADGLDAVIRFGGQGWSTKEYQGYFTKIRVEDAEHTYTTMLALADSATVGTYLFQSADFVAGDPGSIPDETSHAHDMDVYPPCCVGDQAATYYGATTAPATPANSVYLPGMGIGYTGGVGGSQTFLANYSGPSFASVWDDIEYPETNQYTIKNLRTGRYLGEGVPQVAAYSWVLDRAKGFHRLQSGSQYLATSDRYGDETTLALEALKETFNSPFLRYDLQHWHLEQVEEEVFYLRNRACSRVIRDEGSSLRMVPWTGATNERWIIRKV